MYAGMQICTILDQNISKPKYMKNNMNIVSSGFDLAKPT